MVGCVGNNGQNDIVLLCVAIQYFPTDRVILDIQGGRKNASLMIFGSQMCGMPESPLPVNQGSD